MVNLVLKLSCLASKQRALFKKTSQTIETAKETMAHFGFRPEEAVATAQQAADVAQAATEAAGAAVADAAGAAPDAARAARTGVERMGGATESSDKESS